MDSVVLCLDFYPNRDLEELKETYELCSKLFLQRRKTIANNLKTVMKEQEKAGKILLGSGVDGTKRPEQLTPEEYVSLRKASL